ncbi:Pinin [Trichoplax sp. H2]|nr:Pinin [Trichoplax sp. H2]|eukprot:RDD47491.1 Pinin [Trichoplax sp. H2]
MMASELEQKASVLRERIKSVDENIKKLTGRDPSEMRQFQRRGMQRGDNRKRSFAESDASNKYRRADNSGGRRSSYRRRGEGSSDSEADEDEDDEEDKPMIQSSVVVTEQKVSRLQRDSELKDEKSKARNRRMFGALLMGTLQKFKNESQERSEKEIKRAIIEEKLETAQREEKEKITAERRELYSKRRSEQAELRDIERKLERIEMEKRMQDYYNDLGIFIKTKTSPQLFYLPAEHNDKTRELLESSNKEIQELHSSRLKELEDHEANIQKLIAERRRRNAEGAAMDVAEEKHLQEDIDDKTKTMDENNDGNDNSMDVEKANEVTEDREDANTEEKDDDVEMNEV